MDIVRKKISIDRGISHTPGLIPFYPYDDINSNIGFVTGVNVDGNYGQYVCDFGKVESCLCGVTEELSYYVEKVCTSGVSETDDSIEARFKYRDAFYNYSRISEALRTGIFGKIVKHTETSIVGVNCEDSYHDCDEPAAVETESEDFFDVVTSFHENLSKFAFKPLDGMFFTQVGDNVYRFTYPNPSDQEPTESDNESEVDERLVEKWNDTSDSLTEGNFVVLIKNYDEIIGYEEEWRLWCEKWFGNDWETTIYGDQYTESIDSPYFPFCQNFEKYILGKIYVPNEFNGSAITGVYVPEYIYYGDLYNYKSWFEARNIDRDSELQKEWEKHGGDVFFEYLKTISPVWITGNTVHDYSQEGTQERFSYITPNFTVPIVLTQQNDIAWTYESYTVGSLPFSAVGIFSGYSAFSESNFIELEDYGYVESKLAYVTNKNATTVNGIFGVWQETNTESTTPSILKGVYKTGSSQTNGVNVVKKLYNEDGSFKLIPIDDETVEEVAPTVSSGAKRILLVDKAPNLDTEEEQEVVLETSGPDITGKTVAIETITSTHSYDYSWWEFEPTSDEVVCGDGEIIEPSELKYQTISTISNVPTIIKSPNEGDIYYFFVQYDNGVSCEGQSHVVVDSNNVVKTFTLPYQSNTFFDMEYITTDDNGDVYVGNYIPDEGVKIESGVCIIHYVIGGRAYFDSETSEYTPIDNTGIHYEEQYPYIFGYAKVKLDGKNNLDFYYETLDFDVNAKTVQHEDYRLERKTNLARLIGMEVGTTWNETNAIIAPLFTDEFGCTQQYDTKNILDISIDRGIAAAFETNYKLGECNTLEDLENYSNNYFNI